MYSLKEELQVWVWSINDMLNETFFIFCMSGRDVFLILKIAPDILVVGMFKKRKPLLKSYKIEWDCIYFVIENREK